MRSLLLALTALAAFQVVDVRPGEARTWYPWCASFADRSGATSCAFTSLDQCRTTISGIGGGCFQNPQEPYVVPRRVKPRRYYY